MNFQKRLIATKWTTLRHQVKFGRVKSYPLLLGGYPCHVSLFFQYRYLWHKEFKVHEKTLEIVKNRLRKHINIWKERLGYKQWSNDPYVITVHVRRTDYVKKLQHLGGNVVGKDYFINAFAYFKKK